MRTVGPWVAVAVATAVLLAGVFWVLGRRVVERGLLSEGGMESEVIRALIDGLPGVILVLAGWIALGALMGWWR